MIPATLWVTAIPEKTIPQVLRLLCGIGLYYAIVNGIKGENRLRFSSLSISFIGLGLSLIGLVNTTWILDKLPLIPSSLYTRLPTLLSDTIHPNVLAGFLVILTPISLGILLFSWQDLNRKERAIHIAAILLNTLVIIFTQSRGAISAYIIIIALLSALRWKYGWMLAVVIAIIAGVGMALFGSDAFFDETNITSDSAEKLAGRIEIWSRGTYMLGDFPITGVGMGLFGDIADTLYPFFINGAGSVPHAHNLFLQVGIDLGIPGLISWLSVIIIIGYLCWRLYRSTLEKRWLAGFGAGILCSQIGMAVHGLTDSVTWGMVKPAPIVWGIWGLAAAAWLLSGGVKSDAEQR